MTTELSTTANAEYALADKAKDDAITHARLAGEALIQAKGNLAHGEWLAWLANHWDYQPRQAQACMQLARNWQALPNAQRNAHLNLTDALKLLAKPKNEAAKLDDGARKAAKSSPEAPQAPERPSDAEVAQLRNDAQEAFDNAAQLASRLEAMEYANEGAERAGKEIASKDEQIRALKAENARLLEDNARWQRKAQYWERMAKRQTPNA